MMSMNGSPIVTTANTPKLEVDPMTQAIAQHIGRSPRSLSAMAMLTDEDKDQAVSKLEALKNQVASLMEHLKPKSAADDAGA